MFCERIVTPNTQLHSQVKRKTRRAWQLPNISFIKEIINEFNIVKRKKPIVVVQSDKKDNNNKCYTQVIYN